MKEPLKLIDIVVIRLKVIGCCLGAINHDSVWGFLQKRFDGSVCDLLCIAIQDKSQRNIEIGYVRSQQLKVAQCRSEDDR